MINFLNKHILKCFGLSIISRKQLEKYMMKDICILEAQKFIASNPIYQASVGAEILMKL
jgi:hypothetical protein